MESIAIWLSPRPAHQRDPLYAGGHDELHLADERPRVQVVQRRQELVRSCRRRQSRSMLLSELDVLTLPASS